jgi:hypothetical protein
MPVVLARTVEVSWIHWRPGGPRRARPVQGQAGDADVEQRVEPAVDFREQAIQRLVLLRTKSSAWSSPAW